MKLTLTEAMEAPKCVAIDLETTGLDRIKDTPLLMGLYGEDFSGYFNFFEYSKEQLSSFFRDFLRSHSVILHNAKFDFHFINRYFNVKDVSFSDTMLMSQIVDERDRGHGLAELAKKNFGENACIYKKQVDEIWKEIRSRKKVKAYTEVPNELLGARGVEDCENTYKLYHLLRPQIYNTEVYTAEKKLLKKLLIVESNGVLIDRNYLFNLKEFLQSKMLQYENKYPGINLNSPPQVADELYNKMGFKPTVYTATGTPSVAESVLRTIDHPFAKDIVDYKIQAHMLSTYVEAFLERMDDSNRLHCNFKQLGARTSRLSCAEPNLQQVPKGEMIRRAFVGNVITFDYSQMEAVLYVIYRKENRLLRALENGQDLYKAMACQIYQKKIDDISKEERDSAKDIFLGTIYGMGQKKLDSKAQGASIQNIRKTFSSLRSWNKEVEKQVEDLGYVETFFGYRRHLFKDEAYKGTNAIIQGSAAGVLKRSIVDMPDHLLSKFRITVHDENIFEDLTKEEIKEVEEIMTRYSPLLKVKINSGKTWWDCCKDKEDNYADLYPAGVA